MERASTEGGYIAYSIDGLFHPALHSVTVWTADSIVTRRTTAPDAQGLARIGGSIDAGGLVTNLRETR